MNAKQTNDLVIRIDEQLKSINDQVKCVPKLVRTVERHSAYWLIFTIIGTLLTVASGVALAIWR